MLSPIVDSEKLYTPGSNIDLQAQLQRDGVAINLTGKQVTCTIRRESAAATSLGAAWDAMACTLGNPTYVTANGGVRLQKELDPAVFVDPTNPREHYSYIAAFRVVDDDYEPIQKVRFHVGRSLFA